MYLRLKNLFEVEYLSKEPKHAIPPAVLNKLKDVASILDNSYRKERSSSDMGGYILLFNSAEEFSSLLPILSENYHFDEYLYEYDEPVYDEEHQTTGWFTRLYLLSSDDALVMVYPTA